MSEPSTLGKTLLAASNTNARSEILLGLVKQYRLNSDLLYLLALVGNKSAQVALGDQTCPQIKLKYFYTHIRSAQAFLMVALNDPIEALCKTLSTDYLLCAHQKACQALDNSGIDSSIFCYGGCGGHLFPHELQNDESVDWFGWVCPDGHKQAINYHNEPSLVDSLNEKLDQIPGPKLISGIGYHHYYKSNDEFSHVADLFSLMEWILDDVGDVDRFPDLPANSFGGLLKFLASDRSWMQHSPFALPKYGRPLASALERAILKIEI